MPLSKIFRLLDGHFLSLAVDFPTDLDNNALSVAWLFENTIAFCFHREVNGHCEIASLMIRDVISRTPFHSERLLSIFSVSFECAREICVGGIHLKKVLIN